MQITLELPDSLCEKLKALPDPNGFMAHILSESLKIGQKNANRQSVSSLAAVFQELRQLCIEENYFLEIPKRSNRNNFFYGAFDELPL